MSSSDTPSSTGSDGLQRGVKRKRELAPISSAKTKKNAVGSQDSSGSDPNDSDFTDSDSDSAEEAEHEAGDPEPQEAEVLSHAAQRKLKKKAQKEAQQPQLSSSHNDPSDVSQKRRNSIWVGNLAFKTTEQALRAFFQRGVPGCDVTRVNLPTKAGGDVIGGRGMRGENRGFAYVDFMTKEDKEKAIALSEQHLDGRKLLIKDGDDFTGRPMAPATTITAGSGAASGTPTSMVGKTKTAQRILAVQKQPPAPTLFLGNLGFQATEQSIREMIESHMKPRRTEGVKDKDEAKAENSDSVKDKGVLKKVRLGTFEDSGLCKGFAFVDFVSTEDATSVLLDPRNHHLDGRKLVVEYASADAVRRGGGPGAKAHRDKQEKGKSDGRQTGKSSRDVIKPRDKPKREFEKAAPESADEPPHKRLKREDGRHQEDRGGRARRTKPGAALALAQREKVAIVPSSGKKIVF